MEGEISSCMSPLLSKTLESEKSLTVINCILLMNHCQTTQEGRQKRNPSPQEDDTSGMSAHRAPHSSF